MPGWDYPHSAHNRSNKSKPSKGWAKIAGTGKTKTRASTIAKMAHHGRLEFSNTHLLGIANAAVAVPYGVDSGRSRSKSAAPAKVKVPALAAQAADAVLDLATGRAEASPAEAVAKLRQAVRRDAQVRPRHAAVALAVADALIYTGAPVNVQQREALRRAALTLVDPYISISDERAALTTLARAGLERMAPLDEGPLAALLD